MTVRKIARATVAIAQRRCGGGNPSSAMSPWFNDNFSGYSAVLRTYAKSHRSVDASLRSDSQSASMLGAEVQERVGEDVGQFPIKRMSRLGHTHAVSRGAVSRVDSPHRSTQIKICA